MKTCRLPHGPVFPMTSTLLPVTPGTPWWWPGPSSSPVPQPQFLKQQQFPEWKVRVWLTYLSRVPRAMPLLSSVGKCWAWTLLTSSCQDCEQQGQVEFGQPLFQGWEEEGENVVTSCGCVSLHSILCPGPECSGPALVR